MYTFTDVVIRNRDLNPEFIAKSQMKSVVLPQFPTSDEIRQVATFLNEDDFEAWSYEYGVVEAHARWANVDAVIACYEEKSYMNMLIRFRQSNLSFWMPDHHELFVMFGDPASVDRVREKGVFEYQFSEYLQSPRLSEKSKEVLGEMQRKYTR